MYCHTEAIRRKKLLAINFVKDGKSFSVAAALSGSTKTTVHRWYTEFLKSGEEGLNPKPIPGRPPKLSSVDQEKLAQALQNKISINDKLNKRLTLKKISRHIKKEFGVHYHHAYVWRILTKMDWYWQRSVKKYSGREGIETAHWKKREDPSAAEYLSSYDEFCKRIEQEKKNQFRRDTRRIEKITAEIRNEIKKKYPGKNNVNAWGQEMK
jgi:transposase